MRHLFKRAMLDQIADFVSAIDQLSGLAVDEADAALCRNDSLKARSGWFGRRCRCCGGCGIAAHRSPSIPFIGLYSVRKITKLRKSPTPPFYSGSRPVRQAWVQLCR